MFTNNRLNIHSDLTKNIITLKRSPLRPNWYALYTRPHHEKKILEQLEKEKIEAYLPMQTTIRHWSDRKKKVSQPLFSCYIFVNITLKEYFKVLNLKGVIRYVSTEGKAVIIPETQIQLIRTILGQNLDIQEAPKFLSIGTSVEIKIGLLAGTKGELVEFSGKKRVIIHINEIGRSVCVNIPLQYLV
jgi:transcriptional antiterminator RfaH